MKKGFLLLTTTALLGGFLTLSSCGEEKKKDGDKKDSTVADTADKTTNQENLENLDNFNEEVNTGTANENPDTRNQLGDDVKVGEETSNVQVNTDVKPDDGKTEGGRMKITPTDNGTGTGRANVTGTDGTNKTGGRAKIGGGN